MQAVARKKLGIGSKSVGALKKITIFGRFLLSRSAPKSLMVPSFSALFNLSIVMETAIVRPFGSYLLFALPLFAFVELPATTTTPTDDLSSSPLQQLNRIKQMAHVLSTEMNSLDQQMQKLNSKSEEFLLQLNKREHSGAGEHSFTNFDRSSVEERVPDRDSQRPPTVFIQNNYLLFTNGMPDHKPQGDLERPHHQPPTETVKRPISPPAPPREEERDRSAPSDTDSYDSEYDRELALAIEISERNEQGGGRPKGYHPLPPTLFGWAALCGIETEQGSARP